MQRSNTNLSSSNFKKAFSPNKYIELEAKKARRRGQTFNWKTATYGKVGYFDDFDYLKDFENEFSAIVYNDALTSRPKISSEPTISPRNDNQIDFRISFDESDDEDYTVIYDKNSFSYNIISVNDLKTDSENDNDEVDIPSNNVVVEQLVNGIDANIDTESHEFNEDYETNHDIHRESFNTEDYIMIKVVLIRRILGNGYCVLTSCTILGPRERKIDDVGDIFTNLEILKCWSLETSRRQNSCDFTTITINGESEEQRTNEGIIQNCYDREDGETTSRFEA
ncbi:hypothetical protein Tco_0087711 [Tanacetum coccineum]